VNRLRFLATVDIDGWRIKTYAITSGDARPRRELVAAARRQAAAILPDRPDRVGAFGVGFLVVHDCVDEGRCTALIDWWMQPDELHQCAFAAPVGDPRALERLTTAAIGGVSELTITAHEGQAWSRHVIANPAGRDIEGYLADVFHAPN
jgi:hypothetical protein